MIQLNLNQEYRKGLVLQGLSGELKNRDIAFRLNICVRRVQAIKSKYKADGDAAFVHGNAGRRSPRRINNETVEKIIDIKNETRDGQCLYENVNFSHFAEIVKENYQIHVSRSAVYSIMDRAGFTSPKKRKLKKPEKIHLLRPRKECFGELVQADGSAFDWLGIGKRSCIQGFVDDATGIPLGLYMTKNECLSGYLEATRMMLVSHGIPEQMYPDRGSVFFVNSRKNEPSGEERLTQYGRIMKDLGVDMFPAYSPQAKGRIERFWQTIQSRLPVEFRASGIKTIERANAYLPEFIKKYSSRFGVKPHNENSKFVGLTLADMNKLNEMLAVKIKRKTDSSGVVSLFGNRFMIRDCIKKDVLLAISERDGIFALTLKDHRKHKVELLQANMRNAHFPDVYKQLVYNFFLKDVKGLRKDAFSCVYNENVG
jgi:transposase